MEPPDVADLIWLFEDEPVSGIEEPWPIGIHSFRLRRGDLEVLFSLDPLAGDAYISLSASGQEVALLGRLRRVETLAVEKKGEYQGLVLTFAGGKHDPLKLQTRPVIHLSWDAAPLGSS